MATAGVKGLNKFSHFPPSYPLTISSDQEMVYHLLNLITIKAGETVRLWHALTPLDQSSSL